MRQGVAPTAFYFPYNFLLMAVAVEQEARNVLTEFKRIRKPFYYLLCMFQPVTYQVKLKYIYLKLLFIVFIVLCSCKQTLAQRSRALMDESVYHGKF